MPLGNSVTKHNFSRSYLKFMGRKIALKTNKNVLKAAEFGHQKLQMKLKNVLPRVYPGEKSTTLFFPEAYFVNDHPPYCRVLTTA